MDEFLSKRIARNGFDSLGEQLTLVDPRPTRKAVARRGSFSVSSGYSADS